MEENKIILYKDEEGKVNVNVRFADEDVWPRSVGFAIRLSPAQSDPAQSDLQSDCPEYKHLQCVKK